jgi:hypothetical protein
VIKESKRKKKERMLEEGKISSLEPILIIKCQYVLYHLFAKSP